jgi:hypothetical protein
MSRVRWVIWVRAENDDLVGSIDDLFERNQGAERYRATAHNGRMGFFASVKEAEQFILAVTS